MWYFSPAQIADSILLDSGFKHNAVKALFQQYLAENRDIFRNSQSDAGSTLILHQRPQNPMFSPSYPQI